MFSDACDRYLANVSKSQTNRRENSSKENNDLETSYKLISIVMILLQERIGENVHQ